MGQADNLTWGVTIMIAVVIVVILSVSIIIIRILKSRHLPMDELDGHEFEYYCADLLKEWEFTDVEVTRGSGDFGADILAEKDGISYAIQCKCYDKPIGVKAVQEIYAGRDYYDRMVGVVMTNQYFTDPAQKLARKLKIMLWDRDYIDSMACNDR
ncbi:restriction endonuclease [Butyrivibrio sp. AE3004]|uniref:restriction endonuclease n=1 Tax=Butyrivibrio sp. AE3004 TaxID=1506994 RepID=UPI00056C5AB3|nr:restriction endonuclease [Butyrivibrio sp. AE3004]